MRLPAPLAAGALAAILTGLCIYVAVAGAEQPLVSAGLFAILATMAAPPMLAVMKDRLNLAEPVYVVVATFTIYCFIGPLYSAFFGSFLLPFTPPPALIFTGLLLSALALTAFYFGYYSRFGGQLAAAAPRARSYQPGRARLLAILMEISGIALFAAWLHGLGIPLMALNALGSDYDYGSKTRMAETVSNGYLHLGDGFIMAAALLLASFRPKSSWRRVVDVNTILVGSWLVVTAVRWRMLVFFGGLLLMHYLKKGRRPGLLIVTALALVFAVTMPLIGYYRSISGYGKTAMADGATYTRSAMSSLSIFDTFLAVIDAVPDRIPYQKGNIVLDAIYYPIPRSLWPEKPFSKELEVIWAVTGGRDLGYAAPLFGELYIQFGIPGIIAGMFALGVVVRALYMYWRLAPGDRGAQTLLCCGSPFLVTVIDRGYILQHLTTIFNVYLPILIVLWLSARTRRPGPVRARFSSTARGALRGAFRPAAGAVHL